MELKASMLGTQSALHLHHIFPKRRLYDADYERGEVNAIANMCFLTASTNLNISDTFPQEYLAELDAARPGVLASQWITTDAALWEIDAYPRFLVERRKRLAAAANAFLDTLHKTDQAFAGEVGTAAPSAAPDASAGVDAAEQSVVDEIVALAAERGLATPLVAYEITSEDSGEVLAMSDLAWPNGAREGLTPPVALLLGPDEEMERRLGELGYTFFTSKERLVWYIEHLVGADIDGDEVIGEPEADD
jgi:hypothetical protein